MRLAGAAYPPISLGRISWLAECCTQATASQRQCRQVGQTVQPAEARPVRCRQRGLHPAMLEPHETFALGCSAVSAACLHLAPSGSFASFLVKGYIVVPSRVVPAIRWMHGPKPPCRTSQPAHPEARSAWQKPWQPPRSMLQVRSLTLLPRTAQAAPAVLRALPLTVAVTPVRVGSSVQIVHSWPDDPGSIRHPPLHGREEAAACELYGLLCTGLLLWALLLSQHASQAQVCHTMH